MSNINNLISGFEVTFDMALSIGACRQGIKEFCDDYGIVGGKTTLGRLLEIQNGGQWERSYLSDVIKLAKACAIAELPAIGTYNSATTKITYSIDDKGLLGLFKQKPLIKMIWIQSALHRLFGHNAYIDHNYLRSMLARYAASSMAKNNQLIADYGQNAKEIRELIGDYAQDEGEFINSLISVGKAQSDEYSSYDQMCQFWHNNDRGNVYGFSWISASNRFEILGNIADDEYKVYISRNGFGYVASLDIIVDLLNPLGIIVSNFWIGATCLVRHFDELDYLHRKIMGFSLDDQVNFNSDQETVELSALVDSHCTYKNQAIFAENGW